MTFSLIVLRPPTFLMNSYDYITLNNSIVSLNRKSYLNEIVFETSQGSIQGNEVIIR